MRTINLLLGIVLLSFAATPVYAGDPEQILRNLVTFFTGRILPLVALGFLGKNIVDLQTGDPNAVTGLIKSVVAIGLLLGISGVFSYLGQMAR